jgi:glucosamine--fructose-6-phosphate aminotransferase (isomerizing)
MCGIIGYAGVSPALPILVEGIRLLSYRGYDSAGVAVLGPDALAVAKDRGRIGDLAPRWADAGLVGTTGLGHTRWATHGAPTQRNAHPHADTDERLVVVHNGILENDLALREELEAEGVAFRSDTDTEVFAHLFARAYDGDPVAAARTIFDRCRGAFALAVVHRDLPDTIVALRRRSPLLVGFGVGENLVASDLRALVARADRVVDLGEDEIAVVTPGTVSFHRADGTPVDHASRPIEEREQETGKGTYAHYMLKEIHEQPERLYELLGSRFDVDHRHVRLDEVDLDADAWRRIRRVDFIACGTAHYASVYGAYAMEAIAGIPARAVLASEYDARSPVLGDDVLAVAVSQSGETSDTVAALEVAIAGGARSVAVLNVRESLIGRTASGLVDIHAGPEIGVASTKAYTCMLGALLALALEGATHRGRADAWWDALGPDLVRIPDLVRAALATEPAIHDATKEIHRADDMLYLGRGPDAATALEGALKMKEISYIHAEGYPAGEMKHGPIALVSWEVPTVAVAPPGPWRDRMLANVQEVRARDGLVIIVAAGDDREAGRIADLVLEVPTVHPWLAPMVNVIPLQLLAYETAKRRGCDIDQPRNLAKTVTVQ